MGRCRKGDNLRRAFPFKELRAILPKVVERRERLIAGAGDARAILFGDSALKVLIYDYTFQRNPPPLKLEAGNRGQPRLIVVLRSEQKERAGADIELVIHLVLVVVRYPGGVFRPGL